MERRYQLLVQLSNGFAGTNVSLRETIPAYMYTAHLSTSSYSELRSVSIREGLLLASIARESRGERKHR